MFLEITVHYQCLYHWHSQTDKPDAHFIIETMQICIAAFESDPHHSEHLSCTAVFVFITLYLIIETLGSPAVLDSVGQKRKDKRKEEKKSKERVNNK